MITLNLLSFYAVLVLIFFGALHWHHSIRNRFNLADDIIEILRPLVDANVLSLNLEAEFTKEHRQSLLSLLYVDDFIAFMNKERDIISLIELTGNQS